LVGVVSSRIDGLFDGMTEGASLATPRIVTLSSVDVIPPFSTADLVCVDSELLTVVVVSPAFKF